MSYKPTGKPVGRPPNRWTEKDHETRRALQRLRHDRGLTQEGFARHLGITKAMVNFREQGLVRWKPELIERAIRFSKQ